MGVEVFGIPTCGGKNFFLDKELRLCYIACSDKKILPMVIFLKGKKIWEERKNDRRALLDE